MRILFAAAVWAALCVAASAAPVAIPTTIFGVTLGAPLSLPPCPANTSGAAWDSATGTVKIVSFPECSDTLGVHFASGQRPAWVHFDFFDADSTNGVVDKIEVFTQGIEVQGQVMAELTAKFGKPTTSAVVRKQNGYGANFDVIQAFWRRGDGEITFIGAVDAETGDITVKTYAYIDQEQRERGSAAHL